jgi:hypothetical protein
MYVCVCIADGVHTRYGPLRKAHWHIDILGTGSSREQCLHVGREARTKSMNKHAPATSTPPTGPSPRRAFPPALPSTHTGCICLSDAYVPGHAIALLNRRRAAAFCAHASVPVPPASTVPEARTHTVVTVLESDMERSQRLREARICSRAQVQNETGAPIRGPALSPASAYCGKTANIPVSGGQK